MTNKVLRRLEGFKRSNRETCFNRSVYSKIFKKGLIKWSCHCNKVVSFDKKSEKIDFHVILKFVCIFFQLLRVMI